MKVVINRCWGGFGVSTEAMKELIKRNCAAVSKEEWIDESWTHLEDAGDGYLVVRGIGGLLVKDGTLYSYDRSNRTDSTLIALIEEWGNERVNGKYASLKVVEIPDGTRYEIDDYDGMESVEEVHASWY